MRRIDDWNDVLLYLVILSLLFIVFSVLARTKRLGYASCGKCLYSIEKLPTNICPECGSDLDRVGRITWRERRRWAVAAQIITLAWICFFGQLILARIILPLLPAWVETQSVVSLAPTASGAKYTFNMISRATHTQPRSQPYFDSAPQAFFVQIWFHHQGATFFPHVEINRTDNTYTVFTNDGELAYTSAFTNEGAITWLQSLPVNLSADTASTYADTFMQILYDSVDAVDVSSELNAQWERESASGKITMPLKNIGDFRNSRRWSDEYLSLAFLALAGLLWLWLSYRIVRGKRYAHGS